jgi:hypothetical protein
VPLERDRARSSNQGRHQPTPKYHIAVVTVLFRCQEDHLLFLGKLVLRPNERTTSGWSLFSRPIVSD